MLPNPLDAAIAEVQAEQQAAKQQREAEYQSRRLAEEARAKYKFVEALASQFGHDMLTILGGETVYRWPARGWKYNAAQKITYRNVVMLVVCLEDGWAVQRVDNEQRAHYLRNIHQETQQLPPYRGKLLLAIAEAVAPTPGPLEVQR